MIPLQTRGVSWGVTEEILGQVATRPVSPQARSHSIRVLSTDACDESLAGYAAVITSASSLAASPGLPVITQCPVAHLDQDDVVSLSPNGQVRTVYRRSSKHNTLFATDRCNSLCVMCSQPPREVDDSGSARWMIRVVELIHPETAALGITGGEPTLLGKGLLDVIEACRARLPRTSLHLLSNGRRFAEWSYAQALGDLRHPDLMVGIPVYSDVKCEHDFVVQAKGAFEETIVGLSHLAYASVPVEIRVVVHRDTYKRLPQLARYIYRNLTFASHVAFMGLEIIGFAKANLEALWMDPVDYAAHLEEAVLDLAAMGMNVSIYNHQLCTLPRTIWPFCRQSISDWKNAYAPECAACAVKPGCGGFFAWNLKVRSKGIRPQA